MLTEWFYFSDNLFSTSEVAALVAFLTSKIGFPLDSFSRMSKFFCFSVLMSPTTVAN